MSCAFTWSVLGAGGPVSIVMGSEAGAHPCGVVPHTAHIMEESGGSKGKGGNTISRNLDYAHRGGGVMDSNLLPHGSCDRNRAWSLGTLGGIGPNVGTSVFSGFGGFRG